MSRTWRLKTRQSSGRAPLRSLVRWCKGKRLLLSFRCAAGSGQAGATGWLGPDRRSPALRSGFPGNRRRPACRDRRQAWCPNCPCRPFGLQGFRHTRLDSHGHSVCLHSVARRRPYRSWFQVLLGDNCPVGNCSCRCVASGFLCTNSGLDRACSRRRLGCRRLARWSGRALEPLRPAAKRHCRGG